MTSLLSIGVVSILVSVAAFGYVMLQPELANLRSEQMKTEASGDGSQTTTSTPVYDAIERVLKTFGLKPFTEEELSLAGIKSSVTSVVATTLLIAFVAFAAGLALTGSFFFAFILLLAAPFLVKMYVGVRTSRRRAKFGLQMSETMSQFSSALKSGMNVPNALGSVAAEMEEPMGEELARIVNETRLGRDLIDGMKDTAARMDSADFLWVTEAVAIQRESGGRLSEILDRVTETIGQRNELRLKVQSLASEGKASAVILMGLPVAVGLLFLLINRPYMMPLFNTGAGKILMVISLVLYVLGGLWLRSITKVKL
ncbi:type II secretion system F family protein [Aeromicrobium senzhongii]|uniref:Type II secretion system F family protein n=1 Tax=Aeromicrobium senzhongii TaxID=2663859 RepID=A0ABX6SS09_9ACTN|nr:type II secretion system F family protein [Aeromicrobium senzhongii]MTB88886.1 type II secretion system protein F [Aeromicrobium senzhongii]QNL93831.1 type II secretion system F family protein [Aeromicrobium senzhongii]